MRRSFDYILHMIRLVDFEVDLAQMIRISGQLLENWKSEADSGELAGLKYTRYMPIMAEEI